MNYKNLIYALTCLSFAIIVGAAVYEHAALWPSAFSEPPKSLAVFQGEYKLNAIAFWMPIHPVTLVLFILTLIVSWKTARRKNVLIPLIAYVAILVATFTFFVPTIISITGSNYTDTVDEKLQNMAKLWVDLSIVRLIILFALAVILFMGLTKPEVAVNRVKS